MAGGCAVERLLASYGGGFSCSTVMLAGSSGAVGAADAFRLARPRMLEKLNGDELELEVGLVLEVVVGLATVEARLTSVAAGTVAGGAC